MYKILVVDDNPDVLETLCGLLTDEGHIVWPAANEGEALIIGGQEMFDFIFTDLRLHEDGEGDESGLSLALALRLFNPKARITILSHYAKPKQTLRSSRYYGIVDFIEKTQDIGKRVLETIAKASEEKTKRPRGDVTQLAVSLITNQPLVIRAHGSHVCSLRSWKVLRVVLERYARRTELARRDVDNLRFQVGEIGRELWRELFFDHSEVQDAYVRACEKSRPQPLALVFETPGEFLRLPLEFIRSGDSGKYLVLKHPLVRFIYEATPERKPLSPSMLAQTKRLRVLIIASNTTSNTLLPINGVDIETQELCNYLEHQNCIPVSVTLIPTEHATYECISAELKKPDYDIIHYAGHGSYNASSPEESCLYFWEDENKQGGVVPMQTIELEDLLKHSEARLVYLSSCYGTATGSKVALLDDDFLGLADAVTQAGVPSMLGFRWPVSDKGARKLAQAFYQSLLEQGSPEVALWEARCKLAAKNRNDPAWLSPILIHQV